MSDDVHVYPTGATGSKDACDVRYDLISPIAMEALARTMQEGVKHGEMNWENGLPVTENLNRALRHIFKYLAGDRSERHLAHAMTRLSFAIHSEAMWPELNANLRGPGCTPPRGD